MQDVPIRQIPKILQVHVRICDGCNAYFAQSLLHVSTAHVSQAENCKKRGKAGHKNGLEYKGYGYIGEHFLIKWLSIKIVTSSVC